MQAIVKKIEDGRLTVRVRRNYRDEVILHSGDDVQQGDKIECRRETNNPYLQFVRVL